MGTAHGGRRDAVTFAVAASVTVAATIRILPDPHVFCRSLYAMNVSSATKVQGVFAGRPYRYAARV